jgi:hypothetical protein
VIQLSAQQVKQSSHRRTVSDGQAQIQANQFSKSNHKSVLIAGSEGKNMKTMTFNKEPIESQRHGKVSNFQEQPGKPTSKQEDNPLFQVQLKSLSNSKEE